MSNNSEQNAEQETPASGPLLEQEKAPINRKLRYLNPLFLVSDLYSRYRLWVLISGTLLLVTLCAIIFYRFISFSSSQENLISDPAISNSYYPLPELKLRLNKEGGDVGYLAIGITLKLPANAKVEEYKKSEPEMLDALHTYLSSITLDELSSSTHTSFTSPVGLERIRQNMSRRINATFSPLKIETVLFRKLVIQ